MKLRKCVVIPLIGSADKVFEDKQSIRCKVEDKKESPLKKKYNLRVRGGLDNEKKLLSNDILNNSKKISNNANAAVKVTANQGKENKIKKRSKIQIQRLSPSSNIKCLTTISNNTDKKSSRKEITYKKSFKYKNINDKVTLNEISNGHPKRDSDLKNVFVREVSDTNKNVVKHTFSVWKKLNDCKSECGTKRKSFADVYDISQDEDITCEAKHIKKKINSKKNMKRCIKKNKCPAVSNKNAKCNLKYSNIAKPIQNEQIKLMENHQSDTVNCAPLVMKVNAVFPSDKNSDITQTPIKIDENEQNCIFSAPFEVDLNTTSEYIGSDDVPAKLKSEEDKKSFLLNLADELEKSLLIPRMTSTPDSTLLIKPGIKLPHESKLTELDLSHIISKNKKCFKLPAKICDSLPNKNMDITLFESPVKKPQKIKPLKSQSPKKNIQISLFKDIAKVPRADNLEDSVLKPNKAYHSPDNFKTHLARTKRISEIMNEKTRKSKEDMMIEKMQQHFDEISDTDLCIE